MKTIYAFLLLLFCLQLSHASEAEQSNASLLKELDRTIKQKPFFHQQKERETDSIKSLLRASSSIDKQYELYGALYGAYLHYQADSALYYLTERKVLIDSLRNPKYENDFWIARAEVLGIMGLYNEVPEQLARVRRDQLGKGSQLYYYYTSRTYYG